MEREIQTPAQTPDTTLVYGKSLVVTRGEVELKRENTRSEIAKFYVQGFLWIIGIAMIGGGILDFNGKITFENLTALLVTLSGILSGALGFVIGYYFKSGD